MERKKKKWSRLSQVGSINTRKEGRKGESKGIDAGFPISAPTDSVSVFPFPIISFEDKSNL